MKLKAYKVKPKLNINLISITNNNNWEDSLTFGKYAGKVYKGESCGKFYMGAFDEIKEDYLVIKDLNYIYGDHKDFLKIFNQFLITI